MNDVVKTPAARKAGTLAAKATMGLLFGVGRSTYRTAKNFAQGAVEEGKRIAAAKLAEENTTPPAAE
jgi:hypothetical protein